MTELEDIFDAAGFPVVEEDPPPPPPPKAFNFDTDEDDEPVPSTLPPEYLAARARLKQETADRKTKRR